MSAIGITRRHLTGWRPPLTPFTRPQLVPRPPLNTPNMTFSPSVISGGWPALPLRAITTYKVGPTWAACFGAGQARHAAARRDRSVTIQPRTPFSANYQTLTYTPAPAPALRNASVRPPATITPSDAGEPGQPGRVQQVAEADGEHQRGGDGGGAEGGAEDRRPDRDRCPAPAGLQRHLGPRWPPPASARPRQHGRNARERALPGPGPSPRAVPAVCAAVHAGTAQASMVKKAARAAPETVLAGARRVPTARSCSARPQSGGSAGPSGR
jgi:hypothetical protein